MSPTTRAQIVANLHSDSRKIENMIVEMRSTSFASLCVAGREKMQSALDALYGARQQVSEQIKRETAAVPQ